MQTLSTLRRECTGGALALLCALVSSGCSADAPSAPSTGSDAGDVLLFTGFDLATGRGVSYAMSPDGSNRVPLSASDVDEVGPVLSPDGNHIVAVRLLDTLPQVFVMNANGSDAHVVARVDGGAYWPSWAADSRGIVFGNYGELKTWMMNVDGSNVHRLVDGVDDEQLPALSPDGKHVAFTSARQFSETFLVYELFVMNVDGTNVHRLTTEPDLSYGFNAYPRWSPDGSKIAFIRSINEDPAHVFVVNADGTGLRQVTSGNLNDSGVAWSPDGTRLAIARENMSGFGDIFVTNANDGTQLTNVTNTTAVDERFPSWGRRAK